MRGTFSFDIERCAYGAATPAIHRILRTWASVDWFVPVANEHAKTQAMELFLEHNNAARSFSQAVLPNAFPESPVLRTARGGWAEFHALCTHVRSPNLTWDWKFSALKNLSSEHSNACGWSLVDDAPELSPDRPPHPGDLFFRVGENAFWAGLSPNLDDLKAGPTLSPRDVDIAHWYLGYANMDVTECIEWQLAERSSDLGSNPFFPLMQCYGVGFYPFSLSPTELVLFGFEG